MDDSDNRKYHGHEISGYFNDSYDRTPTTRYVYDISRDGQKQFRLIAFMTHPTITLYFKDNYGRHIGKLKEVAIPEIKARIDLQEFEVGRVYEKKVDMEEKSSKSNLSSEEIQFHILSALRNIRDFVPKTYRDEGVEVASFCSFLGFNEDDFFRSVNDLHGEEKIGASGNVTQSLQNGRMFITQKGIEFLKKIREDGEKEVGKTTARSHQRDRGVCIMLSIRSLGFSFTGEPEAATHLAARISSPGS